jgi:hypothetical protein
LLPFTTPAQWPIDVDSSQNFFCPETPRTLAKSKANFLTGPVTALGTEKKIYVVKSIP